MGVGDDEGGASTLGGDLGGCETVLGGGKGGEARGGRTKSTRSWER